jgi:hypothetical protein
MNELQILEGLKSDLIKFFDNLIIAFPEEGDFVIIRFLIDGKYPIEKIMNCIVDKMLPIKDMVYKRNDKFFLENNVLFQELGMNDKVNYFKNLWTSETLEQEDRDSIWSWFERFIKRAEMFNNVRT